MSKQYDVVKLYLKKGREKSPLRRHPWIFSGAVDRIEGNVINGQPVRVYSSDGNFLGIAGISFHSQIRARIWTFDDRSINAAFFKEKIQSAISRRQASGILDQTNAYRMINSEADQIPGLIIDHYSGVLVIQFQSAGIEFFREEIKEAISNIMKPNVIFERSDTDARQKEGLEKATGLWSGNIGDLKVKIMEHGIQYMVDIVEGHKTGFYLDQRDNRKIVSEHSENREVLNCFSYSGGFGLSALAGGAKKVTNIDSSAAVLVLAAENARLNGFAKERIKNITGDVFKELRSYRDAGKTFDMIILDPPKFIESASQLMKGARGYKDINLLAIKLIRPGGLLFTFSCSGHMVPELFRKIVSDAAIDAGRDVQLIKTLQQATDHPVLMNFPESFYLKGLMCQVW
jgi:23S rRNA (cytosine1962-C5)-methyltransferase